MIVCDNNSTSCSCDCFANIDIDAIVDNTTGTPNVTVNREGNKLTFAFSGLKGQAGQDGRDGQSVQGEDGQQGEPGLQGAQGITPDIQVEAHVDNTVGDPSVRVTKSGTIERPMFDFTFSGIKGLNGTNGVDGRDGEDGRDGIDGTNGSNYDDSALLEKINKNTQDIHNILNGLDNTVKDAVDDLFEDSGWVQQHIPQGQTGGSSNFGEDDVEQYLQRLGFWDTYTDPNTGNLVTITKFSKIQQDVDDIRLSVGQIESNQQVGGQVDYTTLAANLYTTIQNNASSAGLSSYWGRLVQVDSTAKKQFLEWMLSAVDTYSTAGETFSTLLSAAHDYNTNQRAYAGLKNLIQYDTSTGGYTASQSLTSLIENTVTGKINQAGLLTSANFQSSSATLFAQGTSAYAAVEAIVNGKTSTLTLSADRIQNLGQTILTTLQSNSVVIGNGTVNANTISTGNVKSDGELSISVGNGSDLVLQTTNANNTNVASDLYLGKSTSVPNGYYFNNIYLKAKADVDINSTSVTNHGTFTSSGKITASGNLATSKIEDTTTGDAYISLVGNSGGSITLHAGAAIMANSTTLASSDESLKNIIEPIDVAVESIADTRIVNYEFKANTGFVRSGTIAQDWQSILPNTVMKDDEDHLVLDYSSVALISAVTDAREIVKLKQENAELKERIAAIEARLAQL